MNLPPYLNEKVNELFCELEKNNLKSTQKQMTDNYKNHTGTSNALINKKEDSILYAISRMPATYSVIFSLVNLLRNQGAIDDEKIKTIIDVGSGTGSGYFALSEIFNDASIELFEKNKNMIDVFNYLSDGTIKVNMSDIVSQNIGFNADFVVSSYVLSELTENDRKIAFSKLLSLTNKYFLLIDTGTPSTYDYFMKIKNIALENGFKIVAPCKNIVCPLQNDYCQFYVRVERTSLQRIAKSAFLPYEDEKYFYMLFEKSDIENSNNNFDAEFNNKNLKRVIRRPLIKENEIELLLCSKDGVSISKFSKKNKEDFKRAKKIKINEEF